MKRVIGVVLAVCLPMWSACSGASGDEAPKIRPKIEVVTGHASAAPGSFEAVAFQCCDAPAAKAVVDSFVALGVALAADAPADSKAAARSFATVLESEGAQLEGDGELIGKLDALAARMQSHEALEDLREEYLDASTHVLDLAAAHRAESGTTYAVGFCPMKPGRWLQTAPPLANPYYGAQMLRCGTFEPLSGSE